MGQKWESGLITKGLGQDKFTGTIEVSGDE